jgi:capsular polysaccharide export protein
VGAGLRALGHRVARVNLHLGDRLFWRGPGAIDYRGRPEDWPGWIAAFLDREAITDLVLLGEQRFYQREAIRAAQARGITVAATDFGYIRPDWLILERDGIGAASRFPRDPGAILALAATLPPIDFTPRYADSFPTLARNDVLANLALLLPWPFPHYQHHLIHHPIPNYLATAWQFLLRPRRNRAAEALLGRLAGQEVHLYAMQMDNDFSIRAYSPFTSNQDALEAAVASFARGAAPAAHLVVKVHPLDPGLRLWPRRLAAIARAAGVAERVHFMGGALPMDRAILASRSVVTVNSTLGLRALELGRPLLALGDALYRVPGLAWAGAPDAFWRHAPPPDPMLVRAMLRCIAACLQIRGVAFRRPGLDAAVRNAVRRLHLGALNRPLPEVLE